jgi:hypothetical protein
MGIPMGTKREILYSGFYDFPLAFVIRNRDRQLLFYREFDDALDEYPDKYRVFILPDMSDDEIRDSWETLRDLATQYLGDLSISEIEFDSTRTKEVDTSSIDDFLQRSLSGFLPAE